MKLKKISQHSFFEVPSPLNLSYFWNFGSFLFFIFLIQLVSGILLSMVYSNEMTISFFSIEYLMRLVPNGFLLRVIHLNLASLFFLFIYLHLFRGLIFGSFKFKNTWNSGVVMILLLMITAFLGYVLPWGQMSFWAATVITKFLSAIPIFGTQILIWVWSSFSVSNSTLKFFFSLHFLLPFILLLFVMFHFISLHFKGSSSKTTTAFFLTKIKFTPFFLFKDFLNFVALFLFFLIFSIWLTSEGENFIQANFLVTPAHIKPEWYFLFAYAILRSIPHKLSGVIMMILAIIVFMFLVFVFKKHNSKNLVLFSVFFFSFVFLSWVGFNEAVDLFVFFGISFSVIYFTALLCFLAKFIILTKLF